MTREDIGKALVENMAWLTSCAMSATGNKSMADDLVQDTCLRALEYCDSFKDGNVKQWLYTLLKTQWYRHLEYASYHPSAADYSNNTTQSYISNDDLTEVVNEREQSIDVFCESMLDIQAALDNLGENYKKAIMLYVEGYSQKEMAEIMGCTSTTVNNLIHRGKMQIKHFYEFARA